MRLIVLGAGIGGLAAAVALERTGHNVTLVERAPEFGEVGAGVVLGPHAMRAMKWLGADEHIRTLNERPEQLDMFDMISGDHRFRVALGEMGSKLYGADLFTTHRRDLIDALAQQLGSTNIMLGRTAEQISAAADHVTVTLDDGTTLHGDALIGADGLKSTVRRELFGLSEAKFSGFLAWRTVLPTAKLGRSLPNRMTLWMGCGRHIVFYPIRNGTQFYAAFYVPAEEIHREDWATSGNVEDLRASFADAEPAVRELIDRIDEAFITGIFYREPLEQWCQGRVLLLGDAAHPVLPTSGSGAGMALEDAVTLAHVLMHEGNDIPGAFREFEARRKPRTTRLLMSSKADLIAFQEENPVKIATAARVARGVSRLDPSGSARLGWLYGHDEIAQAATPLSTLEAQRASQHERPEARRAYELWQSAVAAEDAVDGWLGERAAHDAFIEQLGAAPAGTLIEWIEIDGVRGYRVVPAGGESGPALLHVHGGYFVYGTARGSVALAARIAAALGGWAFVPEYQLAPEYASAAAVEDLAKAYAWLAGNSVRQFVSSEDAGARIAIEMTQSWTADVPRPLAMILISPLTDLTLSGERIQSNAATDPWVTRPRLVSAVGAFIGDRDPTEDGLREKALEGLPPIHIFAAAGEALIDDARNLCRVARGSGVNATLYEADDSVHRYPLFEFLPETTRFLETVSEIGRESEGSS